MSYQKISKKNNFKISSGDWMMFEPVLILNNYFKNIKAKPPKIRTTPQALNMNFKLSSV